LTIKDEKLWRIPCVRTLNFVGCAAPAATQQGSGSVAAGKQG